MAACSSALTETGEGFSIGASYGAVMAPDEVEDATEALQLADRVILLDGGQIVEEAPPEVFFTEPREERSRQFLAQIL